MKPTITVLLASSVLATGVGLAWWFRKPTPAAESSQAQSSTQLPRRDRSGEPVAREAGPLPVPQGVPSRESRVVVPVQAATTTAVDSGPTSSLPETPPVLPPLFRTAPRPADRASADLGGPAARDGGNQPAAHHVPPANATEAEPPPDDDESGDAESGDTAPQNAGQIATAAPLVGQAPVDPHGWRTHTVVNGDTISQLAIRYLGAPGRYVEIYQANRDVLPSADMLKIGTVLRIPPAAGAARSVAPPDNSADLVPITPEVPSGR